MALRVIEGGKRRGGQGTDLGWASEGEEEVKRRAEDGRRG
jgi:hypothetical protein